MGDALDNYRGERAHVWVIDDDFRDDTKSKRMQSTLKVDHTMRLRD
jgi:hypothetical protein